MNKNDDVRSIYMLAFKTISFVLGKLNKFYGDRLDKKMVLSRTLTLSLSRVRGEARLDKISRSGRAFLKYIF